MTWIECCEKLRDSLNENGPDDIKDKFTSYIWEYPEVLETRRQIKEQIAPRLCWIFDDLDENNVGVVFENLVGNEFDHDFCTDGISDVEYKLFYTLLCLLPKYKTVSTRDKAYDIFKYLPYGYWEIIDEPERKKILKASSKILRDEKIVRKYFPSTPKDDVEHKFELIKRKILHPEYYRTFICVSKLVSLFNCTDEEFIKKFEKSEISNFEKDLNQLLRKHSQLTGGLISSYPISKGEINREIQNIQGLEITEEDFISQIGQALIEE